MSSIRSIDYFREVFNTALNYFGRKQKPTKKILSNIVTTENNDGDLIVIDNDEEIDEPTVENKSLLHNSYKLFVKSLPTVVARDANIRQIRVRELYKHQIDPKDKNAFKGYLRLNSMNKNSIEQVDEIADEQNEEFFDTEQQSDEEEHQNELVVMNDDQDEEDIVENDKLPSSTDKINPTNINKIPSAFSSPIQISLSTENNQEDNSSEFFYDFKPENFHAEQVNSISLR